MSTYTFAGTSRLNGTVKVRFANDAARVKVLAKNGHTDIDLIELKHPMTKEEIVAYLREIDFARGNTEIQAAIDAADEKRNPKEKPPKEPKAKKEKAPKKEKAVVAAAPTTDPSEEWKKVVMGIRNQVNEMIERGELDESEFDNKVDELVAAEEAREEAEIRASIEADLEAARANNSPTLIEETTAKVVPVDEVVAEEAVEVQDEEAPY